MFIANILTELDLKYYTNRSKIIVGEIEAFFVLPKSDIDSGFSASALQEMHDVEETEDELEAVISLNRPKKRIKISKPADEHSRTLSSPVNMETRPNISYATMIYQAILSTGPEKKMTLNGIYQWISEHYPYYRLSSSGWQVFSFDAVC